jgi:glycine cleavage system H protein
MEWLTLIEINGLKFPQDRKYYTKNGAHLWLKEDGDFIKIGMDAFAAMMTGNVSFITVDKKTVKSGESIGSFESAKYISKLYSPVSGKIIEVNKEVLKDPSKINKDPYLTWIFKIKPEDMNYKSKYIIKNKDQISNWIKDEIKKFEIK